MYKELARLLSVLVMKTLRLSQVFTVRLENEKRSSTHSITSLYDMVIYSPRHAGLPASLLINLYSRLFRTWSTV